MKMADSGEKVGGKGLSAVHLPQQIDGCEAQQKARRDIGEVIEQRPDAAYAWMYLFLFVFSMAY